MDQVIILAAGKGTRMKSELPKALIPLHGEPMIRRLLQEVAASGVCERPIIVVSPSNKDLITKALQDFNCAFAIQDQPLGTGHAFACTKDLISSGTKHLLGFYGDHPFVKRETIQSLARAPQGELVMMTVELPDFADWRQPLYHWGRIIRGANGQITEIIEMKEADEPTKKITEVNPSFFRFSNDWFWQNIGRVRNDNHKAEYYLTDMVKIAFDAGLKIKTIPIGAREAMGINSPEELRIAESLILDRLN